MRTIERGAIFVAQWSGRVGQAEVVDPSWLCLGSGACVLRKPALRGQGDGPSLQPEQEPREETALSEGHLRTAATEEGQREPPVPRKRPRNKSWSCDVETVQKGAYVA